MKDANDLSGSTRGRYANRDTVAALRAELRFLAARVSALERQEPQPDRPAVAGRADLERVKSVVAAHYGLHPAIFSERCRRRSVVWPRQVGMWLARETTSAALEQVARAFGCASHSTVVKSHAATREAVEADASLRAELAEVRAELRRAAEAENGASFHAQNGAFRYGDPVLSEKRRGEPYMEVKKAVLAAGLAATFASPAADAPLLVKS